MLDPLSTFSQERDDDRGFGAILHSTIILRVGSGLALFFQYGLEGTLRAYHLIWNHTEWPAVAQVAAAGLPWPTLLTCVAGLGSMVVAIAWILGYLTRLFSFLVLPMLLGAGYVFAHHAAEGHTTVCGLFGLIAITLLGSGSGMWSLDRLFKLAAAPKRRKTLF
jgi:uncharacterized membrane protein YphA (DoxX/SURF4 family)